MAFAHGKITRVLYNGYNLSGYLNEISLAREADLAETTTFGTSYKSFLAGFTDGTLTLGGYWDGAAGAIDPILAATLGSDTAGVLTYSPNAADAVGDIAYQVATKSTSYEVSSGINDVTSISAEVRASGQITRATVIHALEAETSTGEDTSVDGAAQSTTGAIAHLHVTAASAADTLDVVIQDSANNTDWSTLGTFAQVSAIGSERLTIAGTVERYVRASWTIGGSDPSFTFAVTIART